MNKKGLIIFIVLLVLYCVIGSVAYYRKVVNGTITGNSGKAVFNVSGFTEVNQSKIITLKDGAIVPGDKGSFDLVMDATGSSVDMYASLRIERTSLPENLKFYISSDYKSELHTYYSYLKTASETLTIYWYWNPYIDDTKDNEFINSNNTENLDASIIVNAVQVSTRADMKNGASSKTEFWSDSYRPYIKTISFEKNINNLPSTCDNANLCFDISSTDSKRQVYAYLKDSGSKDASNNVLYNLYIASDAPIFAPVNCASLFENFTSLVTIDFNNNFNTSNVTNMVGMFQGCTSIVSLDLNSFNTANVTDMTSGNTRSMFYGCSSLTNLYINNFNTKNVTAMGALFSGCSSLTNLDLSSFNTSNVTNMHYMFEDCSSLTSLNLCSFNTSNVNDMSRMFYACESLTSLDLCGFNTSNVTTMYGMFYGCSSLTNLDLSSFNTSNVTNMGGSNIYSGMFSGCLSLTSIDLSNFNTSNVTDMSFMFYNCSSLISLDLSSFNTSNVKKMMEMFSRCSSLTSLDLSNFNTSKVTDMTQMFYSCINVQTQITIRGEITYIYNMFLNAATKPDAIITVNYTSSSLSPLVDRMIATKSSNSNVVKGNQI